MIDRVEEATDERLAVVLVEGDDGIGDGVVEPMETLRESFPRYLVR